MRMSQEKYDVEKAMREVYALEMQAQGMDENVLRQLWSLMDDDCDQGDRDDKVLSHICKIWVSKT